MSFTDAAATDTLAINAGETIQIITDTGGIAMTDSNGDVSGVLELTAHDIWVADQATLDQIANNPTFAGVEELLAINNGPVNPAGNIQAGDLTVTMLGSSFLVQNSGTAEEPAGLTVGERRAVDRQQRQRAGDGDHLRPPAGRRRLDHHR